MTIITEWSYVPSRYSFKDLGKRLFGTLVAAYLFFGGTGAGACVVLAVMMLNVPFDPYASHVTARGKPVEVWIAPREYRRLFGSSFAGALIALIAGSLCLLADAGSSAALPLLLLNPTMTFVSFGAFSLLACIVLAATLAVGWSLPDVPMQRRFARIAAWLMLAAGVCVALYTGLLLSSMPSVPLWFTPWLPVLFVASSLSCGCALVMGCACMSESAEAFGRVVSRIASVDATVIAVEMLALVAFLAAGATNSYEAAAEGVRALTVGSLQGLFVLGFVGAGMVAPVAAEAVMAVSREHAPAWLLAVSAGILVGGFVLRYCIVAAGAHPEVWAVIT